jgi:hypothetical protein
MIFLSLHRRTWEMVCLVSCSVLHSQFASFTAAQCLQFQEETNRWPEGSPAHERSVATLQLSHGLRHWECSPSSANELLRLNYSAERGMRRAGFGLTDAPCSRSTDSHARAATLCACPCRTLRNSLNFLEECRVFQTVVSRMLLSGECYENRRTDSPSLTALCGAISDFLDSVRRKV